MLRKLITLAATAGMAKKAWDAYQERKALDAIAAGIQPQGDAGRKPARKSATRGRRRSEGPDAA